MMETQSYLIFEVNDGRYGIEIAQVQEIFRLPELTAIPDAPGDIIGTLDLRGETLPIIHLAKHLEQNTPPTCYLTDSVLVVEWQRCQIGIIVNRVYDIQSFNTANIDCLATELKLHAHIDLAIGVVEVDDHLIALLGSETFIRQPDEVALIAWEAKLNVQDSDRKQAGNINDFFSIFCPNITSIEEQIFRQRAVTLEYFPEVSDQSNLVSLAVINLGAKYFGVELQHVQEFINIRHVTKIPCCPSHIVGNTNLRGEIITLIDIRAGLTLGPLEDVATKAVVVKVGDIVAGITVDQVLDIVYLASSDIIPVSENVSESDHLFSQGETQYCQKSLNILDISKIFSEGNLIVDQVA